MIYNKAFDDNNPEQGEFRKEWDKLQRLNTSSDKYVSNQILIGVFTSILCVS